MSMCYPETDWLCYGTEAEVEALDAKVREISEARAWYTLASLTAHRIGVCPVTVRPCAEGCAPGGTWVQAVVSGAGMGALPVRSIGSFTPHIEGGVWVNGCGCSGGCGHERLPSVRLAGPVGAIVEVVLDGEVIAPSRYAVLDGHTLVSLDPDLQWPLRQDFTAGDREVGAFSVTYYQGAEPNSMITSAASILAAEFYRACQDDRKCRLPRGTTRVVRGNTTIEVDQELFSNGRTGIPEVDAVIAIYNPFRLKAAPRVIGARGARARRTWIGA